MSLQKKVQVIRYGRDRTTGKPIVSYDDGQSWQWDENHSVGSPDPPNEVYVGWEKISD